MIAARDAAGSVPTRGERRRYSERVLLAWLRRLDSGSWADKAVVEHEHRATVQHLHDARIRVEDLTDEQRVALRRFLATLPDGPARN